MSTLYIRLPSTATIANGTRAADLHCLFALADGGTVQREGASLLANLAGAIAQAQQVVLILAASDVTLLRVKAPPLSNARLKAALPGLVEDQLIADPIDSVVVGGNLHEGLRTVAVVQRAWLEEVVRAVVDAGARRITAVPAQLCLPLLDDAITASIVDQETDIDLAMRFSAEEGIGLPVMPEQPATLGADVISAVQTFAGARSVRLYVPLSLESRFRSLDSTQIDVVLDTWAVWIAGASATTLNMMSGLGASAGPAVNWRAWRWPVLLGAALVLINVIALNSDWWKMRAEADALRATMTKIYRAAYPKETVVVDPIAQMRQKIAAAKRDSGASAPDDFAALAGRFGDAWNSMPSASPIAGLDYRDRMLNVKLKEPATALVEPMTKALAARGLTLKEIAPDNWQVGSAR